MIRLHQPGRLRWLLVLLAPVLCGAQQEFTMDWQFGFFEGSSPTAEPTQPQLDALICETQLYLAEVLHKTLPEFSTVTVQARDIRASLGANQSFEMAFWGNWSSADGMFPSNSQIVEVYKDVSSPGGNPNFNTTDFIYRVQDVTPLDGSTNYFAEVNQASYTGEYGPIVPGTVAEATCPETQAPTLEPTNATDATVPPGNGTMPPVDPPVNGTTPPGGPGGPPGNGTTMPPGGTPPPGTGTPPPGTEPPIDVDTDGDGLSDLAENNTIGSDPLKNDTDGDGYSDGLEVTGYGSDPLNATDPGSNATDFGPDTDGDGLSDQAENMTIGTNPFIPDTDGDGITDGDEVTKFGSDPLDPSDPPAATTPPGTPGGTVPPGGPGGSGTVAPSAPNTLEMVFIEVEYGFEEGAARAAEEDEVKGLICQTNLFYRDVLRNFTQDDTVQVEATNIGWSYNPDNAQPVMVVFTLNATQNDYVDMVPRGVVWEGVKITSTQIEDYIQNYVWKGAAPDTLFAKAKSANFTDLVDVPVPIGQLPMHSCPVTDAPSAMPTTSSAPTTSKAPSGAPTSSAAPTTSKAPSFAPSMSAAPTIAATPRPTPTALFRPPSAGDGSQPGGGGPPTDPPQPTISSAPTITPMPTSLAEAGGPATRQEIKVKYYVSNEANINNPSQVNSSGLSASWPVFSQEVVANITAARNKRRLRAGRRRLAVGLEPGSASVVQIDAVNCPDGAKDGVSCHNVTSSYVLLLRGDETPAEVEEEYGQATINAVDDGSYQAVLDREVPESELVIGIIPKPKSDGGMPLWLLILIILLCVLCCCCILFALFFLMQNRNKEEKALEPYDEEGFVYDFLIPPNEKPQTEVDDDATKAVDLDDDGEDEDQEEFNDDDEEDEDKEEFNDDDDEEANALAVVEADDSDDDEKDEDENEGEKDQDENWEDENELDDDDAAPRQVEEDDSDEDNDETTPLVPVDDEQEGPPSEHSDEEPQQELEPVKLDDGTGENLQDIDDDSDGGENLQEVVDDLADEHEANTLNLEHAENVNRQANLEVEAAAAAVDQDEDWDDEPAPSASKDEEEGGGDEAEDEGWDDEDEPAALPEAANEQPDDDGDWDDDDGGDGGEAADGADEEWDDDDKDGGGEDEGWEDDGDGDGADGMEEGGDEDGWDDEEEGGDVQADKK